MTRSTLKIILTSLPLSAGLLVALVVAQEEIQSPPKFGFIRAQDTVEQAQPQASPAGLQNQAAPAIAAEPQPFGFYVESQPGSKGITFITSTATPYSKRVKQTRTVVEETLVPLSEQEAADYEAYLKAEKALKEAKDDSARQAATKAFLEVMNKAFIQDLAAREKELAEVENRVAALRAQLDKRKAAREEIIGLRLKTIVFNAEGLGFPDNAISQPGTVQSTFPGPQNTYEAPRRKGRAVQGPAGLGVIPMTQEKPPTKLQEQVEEIEKRR